MIDADGFRANVGIIVCNPKKQLLWARRIGQESWQFPQGGISQNEKVEQALYRELMEEVGLESHQVRLLGRTGDWLRYRLPENLVRHDSRPVCYGQKQIWFLLLLQANEGCIRLNHSARPEFDSWKWVDYWHPLTEIVDFKHAVYQQALQELEPLLNKITPAASDDKVQRTKTPIK